MVLTAAPAKSGSPIVEPGPLPALLTGVLCALLAVATLGGRYGLTAGLMVAQGLTAVGWFRLHGMWPARQGIAGVAVAGFAADVAVPAGGTAGLAAALGVGLVAVLVWQTFRPADPAERFYTLTVLGSGVLLTGLLASVLLAGHVPAALLAVAVTTLVAAAPVQGALAPVAALLLGAAAGVIAGAPPVVAGLAAVGALVGRRVASYDFPSRFVHFTAGVALPLAVAAPLAWIGSWLLG
ncbi:hypothetical protein F4556_003110 [Kitasatospora gansuensis]|uniref:Uncharacterized protein n=1 Tax=Kitasatospora gansuensis TaxID=258050 RepID=A0A7W7SBS0_9ACTN|nr:hypothetical protein [Kitasatospora gansuensis]MBB4947575.1 hypothetical protein [Kitasatospora gansuensis]